MQNLIITYRITFCLLAGYFLAMGVALILVPELILFQLGESPSPAVVGMLRGAGAATVPYAMLYLIVAAKPIKYHWATVVIALANSLAIGVDLFSIYASEYTPLQAMVDLPFEIISLVAICIFHIKVYSKQKIQDKQ